MASTIDLGTLAVGVALGYGLKQEIKDAGNICKAGLLAGLTGVAAAAVATSQNGQAAGQAVAQNGQKNG